MRIRVRFPGQSWRGGGIRVKRVTRHANHTRLFLSVTDWHGHELTIEMQKPLALADEIVDAVETFQLERAELAQYRTDPNPNPNHNTQSQA